MRINNHVAAGQALGAALYRVGDHEAALRTLRRGRRTPAKLAFIALSHHAAGSQRLARRVAAELETVMKRPRYKDLPDLIALRDEVKTTLSK